MRLPKDLRRSFLFCRQQWFGYQPATQRWLSSPQCCSDPRSIRPVVDRTGLSGRYDFDLEFAPDESLWGGMLPRPENSDKPEFFRAIEEQLGLQLKATKGPVDALLIDRIERPSEN